MSSKYPRQISNDLMEDILRAQRLVKKALRNKKLNNRMMVGLIRSWQGELGSLRRKKVSDRELRGAELALGFLKSTHYEHASKYEGYHAESAQTDE